MAAAQPCGEPEDGSHDQAEGAQPSEADPQIFPMQPCLPLGCTRICFLRALPPPETPSGCLNTSNGTSWLQEGRVSVRDALLGFVAGGQDGQYEEIVNPDFSGWSHNVGRTTIDHRLPATAAWLDRPIPSLMERFLLIM